MSKIGIVGGVGWPSTIDYYRTLCRLGNSHSDKSLTGPASTPEMVIESLNINKSFGMRGHSVDDDASWAAYDKYFRDALLRLEVAGAQVALIASNTPHNRFAAITRGLRIPVISIFDAIAKESVRLGVKEMLILGTAPTMELPVCERVLAGHGINAFAPSSKDVRNKVVALISELYTNNADDAAQRLRSIVDSCLPSTGSTRTVCLACTELPVAFPEIENESSIVLGDIRYLNSTVIHARAAFAASIA
jgi:aspartate racemase